MDYNFISKEANDYNTYFYKIIEYTEIKYGILLLTHMTPKYKDVNYAPYRVLLIPYLEGFGGRETPDWDQFRYLIGRISEEEATKKYLECTNIEFYPMIEAWIKYKTHPVYEWIRKPVV